MSVDPQGIDEEYPKWVVVCSLCSFQIWGSIPQAPSVTRTGNIYAFLSFFFFFHFVWLSQLHNAASCNLSSVVLLGNSVSFSY